MGNNTLYKPVDCVIIRLVQNATGINTITMYFILFVWVMAIRLRLVSFLCRSYSEGSICILSLPWGVFISFININWTKASNVYLIRLVVGFVTIAKDNINIPIDSCSIDLKAFEKQNPPNCYEFDFVASKWSWKFKFNSKFNGFVYLCVWITNFTLIFFFNLIDNDSYRVHIKCHTEAKIYMGERMECSFVEKWFSECKVNGITGWGCTEWQYLNTK